ncbi:TAXI family TRAP transporter solute-binding subunit [Fluviibacterium sp. DFM31]|uniref:TAXI family TRAP transporter solute-binding subunit n=1 Tax=Meridianimarinicoccus marinus TaxID=3231483 RepID=A0ABV3L310_9RHOB
MRRILSNLGPLLLPLTLIGGLIAAFIALSGLRELVPPDHLTMAAGRPGGGYYTYAEQYRAILARDGIELEILDTAGSMENSRLLARGEADVALIQGGVPITTATGLASLAAVFLEPFLILYRSDFIDAADPNKWPDLRVAAGEPGSGTRAAIDSTAQTLGLKIHYEDLHPVGGRDAAEALLAGEVDVAIFVAPIDAPYLAPLLTDPRINISSLRDTEALTRRVAYVRPADIPPSALDYANKIPEERITLTAMVATLVAQGDMHPALVDRLVRAAQEIHSGPVLLSADLEFPMSEGTILPMNTQAESLLQKGPSYLERHMPYWVAAQITRVTLLLVPLLVLLVPLMRMVPSLYEWQMRARIYRRYNRLVAIDQEAEGAMTDARREALFAELDTIEQEAKSVQVPSKYRENAYTLRVHIDLVRRKLRDAAAA